mmetsp:Transcript_14499/g.45342  ORF Transcript_14499/g.45342 Transcript_14499/m.45342 type:complete len:678 (-) Transcript_14499:44-2077(-)
MPREWHGEAHERYDASLSTSLLELPRGVALAGASAGKRGGDALVSTEAFATGEAVLPWEAPLARVFAGPGVGAAEKASARLAHFLALDGAQRERLLVHLCRPAVGSSPLAEALMGDEHVAGARAAVRAWLAQQGARQDGLGEPLETMPAPHCQGSSVEADSLVAALLAWTFNAHALGPSSQGIFAVACKLNHSCAPNCRYESDPLGAGRARHVATRRIAAGEELSSSYLDVTCAGRAGLWGVRKRRRALYSSKRFMCACTRCVAEEKALGFVDDSSSDAEAEAEEVALRACAAAERVAASSSRALWLQGSGAAALKALADAHKAALCALGVAHWAALRVAYAQAETAACDLCAHAEAAAGLSGDLSAPPASRPAPSYGGTTSADLIATKAALLWEGLEARKAERPALLRALHTAAAAALLLVAEAPQHALLVRDASTCASSALSLLERLPQPRSGETEGLLSRAAAIVAAAAAATSDRRFGAVERVRWERVHRLHLWGWLRGREAAAADTGAALAIVDGLDSVGGEVGAAREAATAALAGIRGGLAASLSGGGAGETVASGVVAIVVAIDAHSAVLQTWWASDDTGTANKALDYETFADGVAARLVAAGIQRQAGITQPDSTVWETRSTTMSCRALLAAVHGELAARGVLRFAGAGPGSSSDDGAWMDEISDEDVFI